MGSIQDVSAASSSAPCRTFDDPTKLRMQLNIAHDQILKLRKQQAASAHHMQEYDQLLEPVLAIVLQRR